MSAAHTPGPWRWLSNHSLVGDHGKRPAVLSAAALHQRDSVTGRMVSLDEASPDALLIEAAPELLDSVGDLMGVVQDFIEAHGFVHDAKTCEAQPSHESTAACHAVQAAKKKLAAAGRVLAKARGEG